MGWGIIKYWGAMGSVVTQRAHVLPKGVANSDFSSVTGKKTQKTKKAPHGCWELVYTLPLEALVMLGASPALSARLWCYPVEHQQVHRTPTSDKDTL